MFFSRVVDEINESDFLNDLYLFYRYFIASNYKNSVPAPHIKELSKKLMKLALHGDGKHRLAVSMPPRHIASDSTPILTANRGWTTHGDLKIGDFVFGLDGNPTEIIGLSPKKECDRKVCFTNGAEILVHEGHLWSVHKRGNQEKELQVFSTSEMENDFKYVSKNGKGKKSKERYRYHLPLIEPIVYDEIELPISPYWLGLWLGDGVSSAPKICAEDKDAEYSLKHTEYDMISQYNNGKHCIIASYAHQGLLTKLKELDLYKNKHIPDIYKKSSIEQRKQLLAGLIDSDGHVDKQGRVRFVNVNKRLIDDVFELCFGLGLYPYMMEPVSPEKANEYKKNNGSYGIISKQTAYCIGFQSRYDIPTKIPRKKIVEKGLRRKIAISDIQKTEDTELGQCIEVDAEDGIYLIGKELIPTHNSKSSMVTLAFPLWLLFQDPNVNIMIVTGSPKLAEKFGIQLREYVRNLGHYFNVYLSNVKQASTHIMFCDKNGKLYKGNIMLATSGGGITGQDADYLILDDPYTGNDEEFTPSALQKKIDWVNRVVEQRIEPHTKYCVLHTRWHALSDDCPVYTINKGWTTHGELEENDILYGDNYKETSIIKVHPKCFVDNILIFSNGDEITCNDQHLWRIINKKENTTRIITTEEIMGESLYYNEKPVFYVNEEVFLIDAYKTEPVTGNCITVDSDDGVYLVGEHFTPTHNSHDIIGYYKETEPELYEFVEFPAINDEGEALWKERYTLQELLKKKEIVGDRVFESVYQQKPIDTTSDFFNMHHLKFGKPEGFTEQSIVRAWDIASSDGLKGDFTAGVRMVRYDDYCVITDLVHGRFGNQTASVLKGTAELDTPNVHIVIETGVAAAGELLYQDWKSQLQGFLVDRAQVSGRGSKADRATPFKNAVEDGKVFVDIENASVRQELLDELSGFPNLIHDDIVDACAHAFNYLFMSDKLGRKVNARMAVFKLW